jgi:hypothetical protein
MNAAEIRQMLRDAIDQFPERDEMLADLGLQTRHSHVPMWLAGVGMLGLGFGLGAYGNALIRQAGVVKRKRPPLWATIGSAVLGAGAGAGVFALVSESAKRTNGVDASPGGHESRVARAP